MKNIILLFSLVALTLSACNKKETASFGTSSNESYLVNMSAYSSTNNWTQNQTNNVFVFTLRDNIEAQLTSVGYNLDNWKYTITELKLNSLTWTPGGTQDLGESIDSVSLSISNDNFIKSELFLLDKVPFVQLGQYGNVGFFTSNHFIKTDLINYVNDHAKISFKLKPKEGTLLAYAYNFNISYEYKVVLEEL
jgi:hypothetical protein